MREESRARILDSALTLFSRDGFAATSVRALAKHAGVSQGLLYNYFESKRELLRAIFERGLADVNETFEAAEAAAPSEALAVLIRAAFEGVRGNPDFWKLTYQIRMQPDVLADVGPEIAARGREIRGRIEKLLERMGAADAAVRATLLFAAIDGAAQHYVLEPEEYPLDAVASDLIRGLIPTGRAAPRTEEDG